MNVKQAAVFCILMQKDGGIVDKSPDYISQKLELVASLPRPEIILDMEGQAKYEEYFQRWLTRKGKEAGDAKP